MIIMLKKDDDSSSIILNSSDESFSENSETSIRLSINSDVDESLLSNPVRSAPYSDIEKEEFTAFVDDSTLGVVSDSYVEKEGRAKRSCCVAKKKACH